MAANSFTEVNTRACERPLKWTKDQLIALFKIESYPKKVESLLQDRGYVREVRDQIALARDQRIDLRNDLVVEATAISSL